MKQHDWTDQLRERLSNYEAAVPKGLWDDIEQSLPQAKSQPLWRHWASIAAIVALLAGSGWWLWTETPVNRQQTVQAIQAIQPAQADQPAQPTQPDAKPQQLVAQTPQDVQAPIAPMPAKEQLEEATEQPPVSKQTQTEEQPKEQPQQQPHYPITTAAHQERKTMMTTRQHQTKNPRTISLGLYANGGLLAINTNPQANLYTYDDMYLSNPIINSPDTNAMLPVKHHIEQRQHHDRPVSVGLSVSYPLSGRWNLQSGLVYTRLHSDFVSIANGVQTTQEQTLHYIGIPLSLQCALLKGRQWRIYASADTQMDWNIRVRKEEQGVRQPADKDRLQWSVGGALGAEYAPIPLLSIYAEPGLRHYFNNGSQVQNFFKHQPTTWTLQLGIRVNLGKEVK